MPSGLIHLPAAAGPTLASFSDDFNRADGAIGAGWTVRTPTNLLRVLSNKAVPTSTGAYAIATNNTTILTDQHYGEIIIPTVDAADAYLIYIRSNNAAQVLMFAQSGSNAQIFTKTTAYDDISGFVQRAISSGGFTLSGGDTLRFEASGNVYTCKRNGAAITGAAWTDSGAAHPVDSSHREVSIGALVAATTRGIDSAAGGDF